MTNDLGRRACISSRRQPVVQLLPARRLRFALGRTFKLPFAAGGLAHEVIVGNLSYCPSGE
jgi:hypothetical protein